MRLACLQFRPELGDIDGNLEILGNWLRRCKADLVVLPELCTTGYTFLNRTELVASAEEIPAGRSTQTFMNLAVETGLTICAGIAERAGTRLFNSSILVGPEGGFSPAEIDRALEAGFQPVGFPTPILRTPTAVAYLAALAALAGLVRDEARKGFK